MINKIVSFRVFLITIILGPLERVKAIRTAGSTADYFISWFLINQLVSHKPNGAGALTCETVNKSSKSNDCYIDSE